MDVAIYDFYMQNFSHLLCPFHSLFLAIPFVASFFVFFLLSVPLIPLFSFVRFTILTMQKGNFKIYSTFFMKMRACSVPKQANNNSVRTHRFSSLYNFYFPKKKREKMLKEISMFCGNIARKWDLISKPISCENSLRRISFSAVVLLVFIFYLVGFSLPITIISNEGMP